MNEPHELYLLYKDPDDDSRVYQCSCGEEFTSHTMNDRVCPKTTTHTCDSGNFSRVVCPEPCGMMHSYCSSCGSRADKCAFDD